MRTRANAPDKKAADREGSDFALSRAERRRRKHGVSDGAGLLSFEEREQAAEEARKADKPSKTIADRLADIKAGFGWFRRIFSGRKK